jgi:selenocysteine-specific elongation factor
MHTIAGGTVIDPAPVKHKRLNESVIDALKTKEKGTPADLVRQFMASAGQIAFTREELTRGLAMPADLAADSLARLAEETLVQHFAVDSKTLYILSSVYQGKGQEVVAALAKYHASFPLRTGLSKEEVRSRNFAGLSSKAFNALLEQYQDDGYISMAGENIAQAGFTAGPSPGQATLFGQLAEQFLAAGFQTPSWDETVAKNHLGKEEAEEILGFFINSGILVKLDDNVLLHCQNMARARELVAGYLQDKKEMGLGEARDLLNTSRKYARPILTYLDKEKLTRRVEDKRVLY